MLLLLWGLIYTSLYFSCSFSITTQSPTFIWAKPTSSNSTTIINVLDPCSRETKHIPSSVEENAEVKQVQRCSQNGYSPGGIPTLRGHSRDSSDCFKNPLNEFVSWSSQEIKKE